ncbi:MAG TPA: lactate racemase domain-containing protein, partial [Gaiellaceae bacterium]|nr:lactate racemase domain-containing protein [Gaiellaceae bacterium]
MKIDLAYGEHGLVIDLPTDRSTVIRPAHRQAAPDERAAVLAALRKPLSGAPLRQVVRPGQTVAISICDGTRAQPRHIVIPAILEELADIVRLEDVVLLVATGTHRGNSEEELRRMLGDDVVDTVRVV